MQVSIYFVKDCRSHIGHLILTLALGPRSGTEKGVPAPFLPLAFAGVWVVANLVLGKTHYPDIITKIYVEPYG